MLAQVMFCFLRIFFQPLHGLVGVRLHRILHLNLQHQVAAALEIQPQPDIVLEILSSYRSSDFGKPMMP